MRLGLALSGGGFRATLFHLGVVRYLRASGLLEHVTAVSGVSGGSIMAAHLVLNWSKYQGSREAFDSAVDEVIRFSRIDVRGRILRRMPFMWLSQFIPESLPVGSGLRTTPTKLLKRYCDKYLFHSCGMAELSDPNGHVPLLYIVATNLSKAGFTCFSQGKLLHIPLGSAEDIRQINAPLTPLALAVAASSALPGFFPPILVTEKDVGSNPNEFERETFADGGVADNLAVNTFLQFLDKDVDLVIISDAGRSFVDPETEHKFGLLRTALRATDLMMFHIRKMGMEKALILAHRIYQIISISNSVDPGEDPVAAPAAIQSQIERLRTDLDTFSSLEAEELIRHGFCVGRAAVYQLADKVSSGETATWAPKPYQGGTRDQIRIAKQLQSGSRRKWRLFSLLDWVSWFHIVIGLALLGLAVRFLPSALDTTRGLYNYARTYRLVRKEPPPWNEPKGPPAIKIVPSLPPRPKNPGFTVMSEHRVWDLRKLATDPNNRGTLTVVGKSLLTRTARVVRNEPNENAYRYWYQTSSPYFNVWSGNELPVTLLTQNQGTVTGLSVLTAYQVEVDVSRMPVKQEFFISVQSLTEDAFKTRDNWWTAMSVTDEVKSASMRILFPRQLPYRTAIFLMYPSDSPLEARTFEGIMLKGRDQTELLWEVDSPKTGYTYKVQWDW